MTAVVALVLVVLTAAACGTQRVPAGIPPSASATGGGTGAAGSCPSTISAIGPSGSTLLRPPAMLPRDPVNVRLCAFAGHGPAKNRPPSGALFTGGAASALTDVLNGAPNAAVSGARCAAVTPTLLLRFGYVSHVVDVAVVSYGCPRTVAYLGDEPRLVDRDLQGLLFYDASAFCSPCSGSPTPDLFGKSLTDATAAARAAGFTISFNGEELDPYATAGTVLLQSPPAGEASVGDQIDVMLAVRSTGAGCTLRQLDFSYHGGGAGAGNDFGTIQIRDRSARACLVTGPFLLTGVNAHGTPDTASVAYPVTRGLVLSPNAAPAGGGRPPAGKVMAQLVLSAEYRDDPTSPDGMCSTNRVVPAAWLLRSPAGSVSVPNASTDDSYRAFSSLLTCRGQLGPAEPITAVLTS